MSKFEAHTYTGNKEFVMEELRISCSLDISIGIEKKMNDFIEQKFRENRQKWELGTSYGSFLTSIKEFLKKNFYGPDFSLPTMLHVIDRINMNPQKDYIIKHAVYVIKDATTPEVACLFLHVIEKIINERRLRLL